MQILQYFSIYVHNFELVIGAKLIIIFQLSAHLVLKNDSATQIFEPILALLFESDDFMIVLTRDEISRCQIGTLNIKRGQNIKYLPFAFTELGVAMLSSVLKSSSAIKVNRDIIRESPVQSKRRPRHRRGHGGDYRVDNRRVLKSCEAGDSLPVEKPCGMPHMYTGIRNQDNPSDNNGTRLSGNSHRRLCCGPRGAGLRSMALSASIPRGTLGPPPYRDASGHAPAYTSNCNNSAPAVSGSRTYPQSRHPSQSPRQQNRHLSARCWPSQSL